MRILAQAKIWRTLAAMISTAPADEREADALLLGILLDRGLLGPDAASASCADRDRSGLLLEHVLLARYGVPLEALLAALAERRSALAAPPLTA